MGVYRKALLAGAAVLAIGLGHSALADPVTLNPSSTNHGHLVVDGSGPFATDGGYGTAYQSMYIATTTACSSPCETPTGSGTGESFDTNVVISIGSFYLGGNPVNGTGIGVDWSLIAVVQLQGVGDWSPTDDFTATSSTMTMQIYAVKSKISGEQNPGTNPTSGFITPSGSTSLSTSQFGKLGLGGVGGTGNTGCVDGSHTTVSSNCILLASSASTSGDTLIVDGTGTSGDSETFSISGTLDPMSYAVSVAPALGGFFEGPAGFTMDLTVNSGFNDLDIATPIDVASNEGVPPIGYVAGNCDFTPHSTACGQPVNWSIDVPEPGSLPLLGTALAFVGAVARRRRKARS